MSFNELVQLDERWRTYQKDARGIVHEVWHRRLWKTDATIEFKPVKTGEQVSWKVDEDRTVYHDLGFVPVEWIRFIPITGSIDGAPAMGTAEFELEDEVNYTLSQVSRAIQYNGEPKVVFKDVHNISELPIKSGSQHTLSINSSYGSSHSASVEMLEINADGQRAAFVYVDDLRQSIHDIARIVVHDPANYVGAMSGTAIKQLLGPMVALVKSVRPQYGNRITVLLSKLMRALGHGEHIVTVNWPDVVDATPADKLNLVSIAIAAVDGGLMTKKTAVESLAPHIGIDDVASYLQGF